MQEQARKNYSKANENNQLTELINRVKEGKSKQNEKVYLGKINSSIANKIKTILGIDVNDYNVVIEARMIEHILKYHGEKGVRDQSMRKDNDISKMEYVINNPDDISYGGKSNAYTFFINGKNRPSDTILYEKEIGDKSFYVCQAVANNKKRMLYIVSAFIGNSGYKNKAYQSANAKSLDVTSKNATDKTSINNIPQMAENNNQNTAQKPDDNFVQNQDRGNGYSGYSMSNNAVAAYEDGEKPLSKWSKSDIILAVAEIDINKA